ncbi:extracellular solute-binding protein [Aeromicrobium sp. P5_D10]
MTSRSGLTWDHPRGVDALRAAACHTAAPCDIVWNVQPLEGFESAPIGENAARHDLVVLDHPHVGEALALGALRPLGEVFTEVELATWRDTTVGPSFASYEFAGEQWAVPLDAATQVSVLADPGIPAPATWAEAAALAAEVRTTLPTSGPHLFLTLCAIAVSNGHMPGSGEVFLEPAAVAEGLEILAALAPAGPGADVHNPITVLEQMSDPDGPQYCPHVYGYVNYARHDQARPLRFVDAPAGTSGRIGSVLGGTGIAVSAGCDVDDALRDHLRWLMSPQTQMDFVPRHAGQPAAVSAWESEKVNAEATDFYVATRSTIEQAWVRPRYDGAIAFQQRAADEVRRSLFDDRDPDRLARVLDALYDHRPLSAAQPT